MDFTILSGTANRDLASAIARELGVEIGDCGITRFSDGEVSIDLREMVRHRHVLLIQPTSPPVNEHLIELLALADICRRASARPITAVLPYFGYSRSDKQHGREPITASMVASFLQTVGVDQVLTIDLHAAQIEGFFRIPVDSLSSVPVLCGALARELAEGTVVVAPGGGRVKMATEYAQRLNLPLVVLHKRRENGAEAIVTEVVGGVRDRACLLVDDIICTGATIANSVNALLDAGARPDIIVAATHGLLLDDAQERLSCAAIRQVYITDTINLPRRSWPKLHVVSVAPLLAAAMRRSGIGRRAVRWTGEAKRPSVLHEYR
jgi:ribose-phosphate pyrophosphokinase